MTIRTRIILSFLLILSGGFYFFADWVAEELTPRYMESVEESLVDSARILAALISEQSKNQEIDIELFRNTFNKVYQGRFEAQIYDFLKTEVDLRVFITDEKGIVIFDSQNGSEEGKDYSKWNDVYLTLRGEYGARSSEINPSNEASAALFVAAPIRINGRIKGSLSVCKPKHNIRQFISKAKQKVFAAGVFSALGVFILGVLISMWITNPIKRLINATNAIERGEKQRYPEMGNNEIGILSASLENMRNALEGKNYIENYVHTLTHELKSPLSAIKGSAELLNEDMPKDKRKKFLDHILYEQTRLKEIIDRLLLLSSLENKETLEKIAEFDLVETTKKIIKTFSGILIKKNLKLTENLPEDLLMEGEEFLISQVLSNLIQNAIDFSGEGQEINIRLTHNEKELTLEVKDQGPGIPEYAMDKIFDKFYSLPRPSSKRKSSGLGLCFVKLVTELHDGKINVMNDKGVKVQLVLPLKSKLII